METFYEWVARLRLAETYYGLDPAEYNALFDQELEKVVQRTHDPAHRQALESMRGFNWMGYVAVSVIKQNRHPWLPAWWKISSAGSSPQRSGTPCPRTGTTDDKVSSKGRSLKKKYPWACCPPANQVRNGVAAIGSILAFEIIGVIFRHVFISASVPEAFLSRTCLISKQASRAMGAGSWWSKSRPYQDILTSMFVFIDMLPSPDNIFK